MISGQCRAFWANRSAICTSVLQVSYQHRSCFFLGQSPTIAHRCVCTYKCAPALHFSASSSWAPDCRSVGRSLAVAWHSLSTPNGCLVDVHPVGLAFSPFLPIMTPASHGWLCRDGVSIPDCGALTRSWGTTCCPVYAFLKSVLDTCPGLHYLRWLKPWMERIQAHGEGTEARRRRLNALLMALWVCQPTQEWLGGGCERLL